MNLKTSVFLLSLLVCQSWGYEPFSFGRLKFKDFETKNDGTCGMDRPCPNGFYCKSNNCIAKKPNGLSCNSMYGDVECVCGRCVLDRVTWQRICMHSDECDVSGGFTKFNKCTADDQCPNGYFCNLLDDNLCTSKYTHGQPCHTDNMCKCGECITRKVQTRLSLEPIEISLCGQCQA